MQTRSRRFTPTASLLGLLAGVGWMAATALAHSQAEIEVSPLHPLHVLADYEVPSTPSVATSVRWASDGTVYLSRLSDGVSEVALDPKFGLIRTLVPDQKTMHLHFAAFSKLAVSASQLAVSSSLADFAFRPVAQSGGSFKVTKLRVGIAYAFDLAGDRLLLVGDLVPNTEERDPAGAVAWIGPLSAFPRRDLHPILYDAAGASAPSLLKCAELQLGAARFLADGSFVVVPGFQAGVLLFGPRAQLVHTWQSDTVGLDVPDCLGISPEQEERFATNFAARFDFLNQHRVVDEILPLPQGPGLVVRQVADGRVHWTLKILLAGGGLQTFEVPFTGSLPFARLRGDVRGNRIVLLRTGFGSVRGAPDPSGRLYLVEIPPVSKEVRP